MRYLSILALASVLGATGCDNGDTGGDAGAGDDLTVEQRAYCETACGCGEDSDGGELDSGETVEECEEACADTLGANLHTSEKKNCGTQYETYLVCLGETFVCGDDVGKVCADELAASRDAC